MKKIGYRTKPLMLALFLLASQICAAESIFGIEIGAQFSVPKCGSDQGVVCYDGVLSKPVNHPWGSTSYDIKVPATSTSWGIQQYGFRVTAFQNEVVHIAIKTYGERDQGGAFSDLKKKFGDPTKRSVVKLQNRMGARFDGIRATWNRPTFTVEFDGASGSIDDGYIMISAKTQAAKDEEKASAEWRKQNMPNQAF